MKKMTKKLVAMVGILSLVLSMLVITSSEVDAAGSIPIYRLNNPVTGEYLYTSDVNELNVLTTQGGWNSEGIGWNAPQTGTPIYRLNNPGGFHLYTSDQNEINVLTTERGWLMDNNNVPMFYSGGNVDVYRLYHPATGRHLLTSSKAEYDNLAANGWNAEGVAVKAESAPANVPSTPTNNTTPPQNVSGDGLVHVAVDGAKYILNTDTHVIHNPSCRMVNQMNDSNKAGFNGSVGEANGAGYKSCGICKP